MPSASSFPSSSTSLSVPVSRCYITHLLNALPALAYSSANPVNSDFSSAAAVGALTPPNPLTAAPDQAKKQLLALQVVFPNEFLPALDLLDRRLVTRFQINRKGNGESNKAHMEENAADRRLDSAVAGIRGAEDLGSDGQQRGETETIEASEPSCEDVGLLNPRLSPTQRPSIAEPKDHALAQDANAASLPSKEVPLTDTLRGNPEEGEQQSLHQPLRTSAEQILPINNKDTVYYVRSAQPHSSRYAASYDATTYYEVRLQAWNCSCPAFAFAAFPPAHPEPPVQGHNPSETLDGNVAPDNQPVEVQWVFGGISLGEGIPPVCKHLLACVLAERCGTLFGGFIESRDVSVEEAAGWAAGWGD